MMPFSNYDRQRLEKMNHFQLLRNVWILLREKLIAPIKLLSHIEGLTDKDIESIKAAYRNSEATAIDRLHDVLRNGDKNCLYSFISALYEHDYTHIAQEIMKIGDIQRTYAEKLRTPSVEVNLPGRIDDGKCAHMFIPHFHNL
jgi:hypothetical protein